MLLRSLLLSAALLLGSVVTSSAQMVFRKNGATYEFSYKDGPWRPLVAAPGSSTLVGPPGPVGPTPQISISVATGAPGSLATITKTGSGTAIGLNFQLPRGDVGPAGTPGIQGIQGVVGPTGPAGTSATVNLAPIHARIDSVKTVLPAKADQSALTSLSIALGNQFSMAQLRATNPGLLPLLPLALYITDPGRVGTFVYDASDTTTPDDGAMCLVVAGRRYLRDLGPAQLASPLFWGATANDGTDDQAAFNASTAWARLRRGVTVVVPGGDFNFSDTWKITGSTNSFQTLTVRGSRSTYFEIGGTRLIFDLMPLDRVGVAIGSARQVQFEGFTILGRNIAPLALPNGGFFSKNGDDYLGAGVSDGRYNPYTALAIDPFADVAKAGSYTNDTFGKSFSSRVKITGCSFQQWAVGIAIAPAGRPQNDGLVVEHCDFRSLKWGVSVGTTQARDALISSCAFAGVWKVITNRTHGELNGEPPATKSLDIINTFALCDLTLGTGGFSMEDSHAETFASLGTFASNHANTRAVNFTNCNFNRYGEGKGADAALFIDGSEVPINFYGGSIWADFDIEEYAVNLYNIASGGGYVNLFGTTVFNPVGNGTRLLGLRADQSIVSASGGAVRNNSAPRQPWLTAEVDEFVGGRVEVTPAARRYRYGGANYAIETAQYSWAYGTSPAYDAASWAYTLNAATSSTKGGSVTLTSTQGGPVMQAGDYLFLTVNKPGTSTPALHTVPAALITSVSGSSVTARMLVDEINTSSSPANAIIVHRSVLYGTQGIEISTANATPTVTVTKVDGVSATSANVASYLRVGDWLYSETGLNNFFGTRITAITGTVLTLNRNVVGTQTNHAVYSARLARLGLVPPTKVSQLAQDVLYVTPAQSNTFTASQYITQSVGIGTTTLSDGAATWRNATLINNNENGAGWFTNNQSLPGYRGMVSITAYGANDARLGGSRPKNMLFLENWITAGFANFQVKQAGNAPFVVNQQQPSLNYLNHNLFWDNTGQVNASGQQVNSQSYFYVQGSAGTAATFNDSKGYLSRGQFVINSTITNHSDFQADNFIQSGVEGTMGTRFGLNLAFSNLGITNAWGVYQSGSGVKNYLLGRMLLGNSGDNGRDQVQVAGSILYQPVSATANPTTTDVLSGSVMLWRNTVSGKTAIWLNQAGTLVDLMAPGPTESFTNLTATTAQVGSLTVTTGLVPASDGGMGLGAAGRAFGNSLFTSVATDAIRERAGIGINVLSTAGTQIGRLFPSTGNLRLQNGGTYTDNGARLQVGGTTFTDNLTATTGTFGSLTVNGVAITGNGSGTSAAGQTNPNVIVVFANTVAAMQTAINSVTAAGTIIQCAYNRCDFGDAQQLYISNKPSFTIDMNGATWTALSTRTMVLLNNTLDVFRLTNGKIFNNSPTLPYNATYGYFATISTDADTKANQLIFDHLEITTPNADQNAFLFNTYRDVAGSNGSTCLIRSTIIDNCYGHDIGRMFAEFINGGSKYGDKTERYLDTHFTNNHCLRLGLQSPQNYGMMVSLDGASNGGTVANNTGRNCRGGGIEIVNGRNITVTGNTVIDDSLSTGPGCVGITITDNRQFLTRYITVSGNTIDTKGRAIQIREASYVTVTGNQFRSKVGSNFIVKRSKINDNTFYAWAPAEPVVTLEASGDGGIFWTSTENTFQGNTVTNFNANKPGGYAGPYQLLRLTSGSRWNMVDGNFLILDPVVTNTPANYIEHLNSSEPANNYMGTTNIQRVGRNLGYGD